jgi:hypothetical protein
LENLGQRLGEVGQVAVIDPPSINLAREPEECTRPFSAGDPHWHLNRPWDRYKSFDLDDVIHNLDRNEPRLSRASLFPGSMPTRGRAPFWHPTARRDDGR